MSNESNNHGAEWWRDAHSTGASIALAVTVFGSISWIVGGMGPWNNEMWDADDSAAEIALLHADRAKYAFVFGLLNFGVMAVGVGLFLLGRAVACVESPSSSGRARAATAGSIAGAITALGGLGWLCISLFATPEFFVNAWIGDVLWIAEYGGVTLAMLILASLAWQATDVPKAAVVFLAVGALAGFVTFISWWIGMIIFAVVNLAKIRRQASVTSTVRTGAA